jgi:SpoOM protein
MTPIVARANSHGIVWRLDLERQDVLPGTTLRGTLAMEALGETDGSAVIAALIATEQWQVDERTTDGHGGSQTRTVTHTAELQRLPVRVAGPTRLASGERREIPIEVPVPPLGPATLEATVSRLTWELEAKLDRAAQLDPAIVAPVRVLQPTALLRAGVVRVGEFGLYESADSATSDARASVEIKPMPICTGAPIDVRLTIDTRGPLDLQGIRAELRVAVKATVSSGRREELTVWVGRLAGPGRFGGAAQTLSFHADIPAAYLPTIELPHGRTDATFHVILARAWERDPHLIRDVAICTTTEI